tara:strand:- start:42 stop:860 length:819 start_codon:yes stop_codon:yes gene_type:complete
MAETLTYDPGTDTVSTEDNLTPEEQDSLQVGEQMQVEQEQLLAGKYKNAEDLEKAYVELQKKLGETGDETSETTGDTEPTNSEENTEETEEVKEDSPAVSLINEASAEYYANDNKLSPETIEKFSQMSSQDLVNAYIELQQANPQPQTEAVDVSQADINTIQNSVGGQAEYSKLTQWAADNLDEQKVSAFDSLIETGNVQAIQLAVAGLKTEYENANGYEGRMLSGKAPKASGDVFRSQAQLVEAMSDPRYDNDPAYRQDVIAKLDRSDLNF